MEMGKRFVSFGICTAVVLLVLSATAGQASACGGAGDLHEDSAAGCPMMAKADTNKQREPNMVCPMETMRKYQFLATMPIYLDSPAVLYARAEDIGLSEEQKAKLLAITAESRSKAIATLTSEQRQKLGVLSDEPITMSQICPMMRSKADIHHEHHAAKPPEAAKVAEQTVCPVMGGKVNKEIFTDYEGKKVYFCCPACKPEFEKNPQKYISKLPQFQKQETGHSH